MVFYENFRHSKAFLKFGEKSDVKFLIFKRDYTIYHNSIKIKYSCITGTKLHEVLQIARVKGHFICEGNSGEYDLKIFLYKNEEINKGYDICYKFYLIE
ncbi:unnamed protein product [Rhizophagus irregularis]|nr:unnamed protein product [Rhizophagus irregularis]